MARYYSLACALSWESSHGCKAYRSGSESKNGPRYHAQLETDPALVAVLLRHHGCPKHLDNKSVVHLVFFFFQLRMRAEVWLGVLVWRIWKVERQSERFMTSVVYRPRRLQKVMRVIAESGAAYTACVLVTFIVSATRSNAMYPTADMVCSTAIYIRYV